MDMACNEFILCTIEPIMNIPRNSILCYEIGKNPKCHGFIAACDTNSGFARMIPPGLMK